MTALIRDHGGGVDLAVRRFGGARADWLDLSTGINPVAYPLPSISELAWTALPDTAAQTGLLEAARRFWSVPSSLEILAAPGASALIAAVPKLLSPGDVCIAGPTYNEHAASFTQSGWHVIESGPARASVIVHPNNPTGHWHDITALCGDLRIIDESFGDVAPERSLLQEALRGDTLILKSFGKFWGLAGLRLGFAIGPAKLISPLRDMLGPWPVAGPALEIGTAALNDQDWANATRQRLHRDARRLDVLMMAAGAETVGGTSLFRLYDVNDANGWQDRLARHHIWSRVFPYNDRWLRLGLPGPDDWTRLEAALT